MESMKRRNCITLIGCAVAWPLAACAQHYFEAKRVGAGDAIGKRGGPARIGGKIAAPDPIISRRCLHLTLDQSSKLEKMTKHALC